MNIRAEVISMTCSQQGILTLTLLLVLAGCAPSVTQEQAFADLRKAAETHQMSLWRVTRYGDGSYCASAIKENGDDWISCGSNAAKAAETVAKKINAGAQPSYYGDTVLISGPDAD